MASTIATVRPLAWSPVSPYADWIWAGVRPPEAVVAWGDRASVTWATTPKQRAWWAAGVAAHPNGRSTDVTAGRSPVDAVAAGLATMGATRPPRATTAASAADR